MRQHLRELARTVWHKLLIDGLTKTLFALIAALLFGVFYLSGDIPTALVNDDGHFEVGRVPKWLWLVVTKIAAGYMEDLKRDPAGVLALILVIVVVVSCAYILLKFCRQLIGHLRENARRKQLLTNVGLVGYWPNAGCTERSAEWANMAARISEPPHAMLCILGATGWETWGDKNSPLHNAVRDYRGPLRVILMAPESTHLPVRAASVGMTVKAYKNQIRKATKLLRDLKAKGHRVQLRTYDSPPNWKMVITSKRLWLQHYHNDSHVEHCPVYLFYSTDSHSGLYHCFYNDFERVWSLSKECSLDAPEPPRLVAVHAQ